jgi:DNA-directed RNA polymerase specialized sigma subunit
VLERKEVILLLAQRIGQLPLASKKLLAMYYYENLPISEIADCFNLPGCRIYEILTQTVGLLRATARKSGKFAGLRAGL